jgi:site-specific recombinase XerD
MKDCGLVLNTISFHFRVIRTVYNKAVEAGHCHDQKPFKYAYTSIAKTVKRAIPFDVIKAIKQYRAENAPVAYAQDMFMFSFYTRGMSFVDMAYLKSSNIKDGILTYQRRKTGQTLRMKWEPCMQQIVDRYHKKGQPYLLPIIHSQNGKERNQYRHKQNLVNQNLKLIASSVNCEHHLTLYVARHSWATIAEQHGLPVNLISLGLGHNSEKTTQIYLKSLRQSQIDEANANIISMMGD